MKRRFVCVEKLNGDEEQFETEAKGLISMGITIIGYSFICIDGSHIIIHPSSVYKITIIDEEVEK